MFVFLWILLTAKALVDPTECRLSQTTKPGIKDVIVFTFNEEPACESTNQSLCNNFTTPDSTEYETVRSVAEGINEVGIRLTNMWEPLQLDLRNGFLVELWTSEDSCVPADNCPIIDNPPPVGLCCEFYSLTDELTKQGQYFRVTEVASAKYYQVRHDGYCVSEGRESRGGGSWFPHPDAVSAADLYKPAGRKYQVLTGWRPRLVDDLDRCTNEMDELLASTLTGTTAEGFPAIRGTFSDVTFRVGRQGTPTNLKIYGAAIYILDEVSNFPVTQIDCLTPNSRPLVFNHARSFPEGSITEFYLCPDGSFDKDNSCIDVQDSPPYNVTSKNLTLAVRFALAEVGIGTLTVTKKDGTAVNITAGSMKYVEIDAIKPLIFTPAQGETSWRYAATQPKELLAPCTKGFSADSGYCDSGSYGNLWFAKLNFKVADVHGLEAIGEMKMFVYPVHNKPEINKNRVVVPSLTANVEFSKNQIKFVTSNSKLADLNTVHIDTDRIDVQLNGLNGLDSSRDATIEQLEFPPQCYSANFQKCYAKNARLTKIKIESLPDFGTFFYQNGANVKVGSELNVQACGTDEEAISLYFQANETANETGGEQILKIRFKAYASHTSCDDTDDYGIGKWYNQSSYAPQKSVNFTSIGGHGDPIEFNVDVVSDTLSVTISLENALTLEKTTGGLRTIKSEEIEGCPYKPLGVTLDVKDATNQDRQLDIYIKTLPERGTLYANNRAADTPEPVLEPVLSIPSGEKGVKVGTWSSTEDTDYHYLYYKPENKFEYNTTASFEYFLKTGADDTESAKVVLSVQDCDDPARAVDLSATSRQKPILCDGTSLRGIINNFEDSWCDIKVRIDDPVLGEYQDSSALQHVNLQTDIKDIGYGVKIIWTGNYKLFLDPAAIAKVESNVESNDDMYGALKSRFHVWCALDDCNELFKTVRIAPKTIAENGGTQTTLIRRSYIEFQVNKGLQVPTSIPIHIFMMNQYAQADQENLPLIRALATRVGPIVGGLCCCMCIFGFLCAGLNKANPKLVPNRLKRAVGGGKVKSKEASKKYLHNI